MTSPNVRLAQRRGLIALMGRETRRVVSLWTQTILPPFVNGVLLLAIFGGALGSRIEAIETIPYLTFILPGLLVMTVAVPSFSNASTSLFQAKSEGYIDDLLTSPLRGWHLALAYLGGSLVRGYAAAAALAVSALPFAEARQNAAAAVVALALTGLLFGSLGIITGVWADTFDQHSFIASIVVTPLALVAGVFYAAGSLPEPWATLTRFDPLFYLVDATRAGLTGFHEAAVWLSLAITAAAALGAFTLASVLLGRGWRVKA